MDNSEHKQIIIYIEAAIATTTGFRLLLSTKVLMGF